ncbi:MAG: polysaccharide pyruvyl transferase family protein [Muribaculaceae bacterium]|nr:polysaccharide pyruvyl transferase family protein [Muribaculaceae bacterium]
MKIGIVTHPLGNNYGGLLQAYALQEVLKRQGHDVWIFQKRTTSWMLVFLRSIRNAVYRLLRRFYVSQKDKRMLSRHMLYFSEKYVNPKTPKLGCDVLRRAYLRKNKFNTLIVGSDQVWRPMYVGNIEYYFLSFTKQFNIRKVAYAASFGVDNWEFTQRQTDDCKSLIHDFNAVSVREDTGIELCKNYLDYPASLVLDPTLLLDKEDFIKIINNEGSTPCEGDIFYYFLDRTNDTNDMVSWFEKTTNLVLYTCMPRKTLYSDMNEHNKGEFVYPPVAQWLRSFYDAKMVLTDSFHGCVFSIIFNKPFWVITNKKRGAARFESLLNIFRLQDRMIPLGKTESIQWDKAIDWESVNAIKKEWQKKSLDFLNTALS